MSLMKLLDKRHVGEMLFLSTPIKADQQSRPAEGTKWKFNVVIRLSAGGFLDSPYCGNTPLIVQCGGKKAPTHQKNLNIQLNSIFKLFSCIGHTQTNTNSLILLGFYFAGTSSFDLDGTAIFAVNELMQR